MSEQQKGNEILLVKELRNGNEKAFRKLFDSYRNDLYKFSLSMVCSKNYAEEIVQDVFMKVWIKRESLNPEMSFKSYLFTITRNKNIKFLKKAANNKKLREEIFYKNQKLNGVQSIYYWNGELKSETQYKNGIKNGTYKEYDHKGELKIEGNYFDNERKGLFIHYNMSDSTITFSTLNRAAPSST